MSDTCSILATNSLLFPGEITLPFTFHGLSSFFLEHFLQLHAKWFFADYRLADYFPSALPGFRHKVGIGIVLGTKNETKISLGYNTKDIFYFPGHIPIENKVLIEPLILWGLSPQYITEKTYYKFSLGVGYQFGFSERKRKKT